MDSPVESVNSPVDRCFATTVFGPGASCFAGDSLYSFQVREENLGDPEVTNGCIVFTTRIDHIIDHKLMDFTTCSSINQLGMYHKLGIYHKLGYYQKVSLCFVS